MKTLLQFSLMCLLTLALVSCSKNGGDGTDPFGGGGGSSALTGKWTSISATGTVGYSTDLGAQLAAAVNQNIATYNLTNVVVFQFETNGKLSLYDMGELYEQGTYSLKGNTLTLTNSQNQSLNMNIAMSESEFTLSAAGTDVAVLVAWAIGDTMLKVNNYGGMFETGVQVSQADLTVKFKKQ
jgi:hypothetical protein